MNEKINKILNQYINKNKILKIIIFRTDRIGDVVLSINIAENLKKFLLELDIKSEIIFAIRNYTKDLLLNNPFIDKILIVDNYKFKNLVNLIKQNKISISLFASKIATYAPFFARIPIRIGPLSKLRSIFFNIRVFQNRSKSIKNESEYNFDLIKKTFNIKKKITYPKIFLTSDEILVAKNFLKNKFNINENEKFIIIHPGSEKSSKDLPIQKYIEICDFLFSNNIKFIISGHKIEINQYKNILKKRSKILKNLLDVELTLKEFCGIISQTKIFISNSTGPLHIASALNIKTISFYPNLISANPLRWGPFSEKKENNFIFTPNVPKCKKCKENCKFNPCMNLINIIDIQKKDS